MKLPTEIIEQQLAVDERLDILRSYARSNPNVILGGVSPATTQMTMNRQITAAFKSFKAFSRKSGRGYLILYVIGDHGWHLGKLESRPSPVPTVCRIIAPSLPCRRTRKRGLPGR